MIEITVLGWTNDLYKQMRLLSATLQQNGLPDFSRLVMGEIWENKGFDVYSCRHLEIDASEMCASTPLQVQKFLIEAMKLPHVFLECPECSKRRFREKKEEFLKKGPQPEIPGRTEEVQANITQVFSGMP